MIKNGDIVEMNRVNKNTKIFSAHSEYSRPHGFENVHRSGYKFRILDVHKFMLFLIMEGDIEYKVVDEPKEWLQYYGA